MGGGVIGARGRWLRAKELQMDEERRQLAQFGEPPRGRYRWETSIYGGKDRKGKGNSEEDWNLHTLERNRREDQLPISLGPEWLGGRIANYAKAAGAKPAPLRPSKNLVPKSSGTLEDYYYAPLPTIKRQNLKCPRTLLAVG